MEFKIRLNSSCAAGFLAGILLCQVLAAAALGLALTRNASANFQQEESLWGLPSSRAFPRFDSPAGLKKNPVQNRRGGPEVPSQGPENAIVTILEFSDFQCPDCPAAASTLRELTARFPGKIRREFHYFPTLPASGPGQQDSLLIHEWSVCAAGQGKFWPFYEAVQKRSRPVIPEDLPGLSRDAGLNTPLIEACVNSGKSREFILKDRAWGAAQGAAGPPPFFIVNGQKISGPFQPGHFSSFIEALAKKINLPQHAAGLFIPENPSAALPASRPEEGKRDILFDDLAGRPSRGAGNPRVTLVEFSDFSCVFCGPFERVLEQLEKKFPGEISRVWRHYPLALHKDAEKAHEASECAHEQGKFWEYHDKLFEAPESVRNEDSLAQIAQELKLDMPEFRACLGSDRARAIVQKDRARGMQSGVNGTPVVFVNGQIIQGALPYEKFEEIIKSKLRKA